jgi:hypothetical protein
LLAAVPTLDRHSGRVAIRAIRTTNGDHDFDHLGIIGMNRGLLRKLAFRTGMRRMLYARIRSVVGQYIKKLGRNPDDMRMPTSHLVCLDRLSRRTDARGRPNTNALGVSVRDIQHALWNTKVMGSELARLLYEAKVAGSQTRIPSTPTRVGLTSQLCTQRDIEHDWLRYWCGQLHITPIYHRKVWEDCFVLQALWENDMLRPGRRGLGFAVGVERLPAYFAAQGVSLLATDLSAEDSRAAGWRATNQHAESLAALFKDDLVSRERFDQLCQFRPVDMNAIPRDLYGGFDFCWSVCSFEHLGSIERGLVFVLGSLRCLKPGGIAIHTTEFNLDDGGETIDDWGTVLFQRRHIDDLAAHIATAGHHLCNVDYNTGDGVLDQFIDVPPFPQDRSSLRYPEAPHLRLSVDGFPVTSIGLIARAGG